jgi:sugar lactone lactonase YvrE
MSSHMTRHLMIGVGVVLFGGATVFGQLAIPPGANVQGPQDAGYQALIATCKTPPPAAPARGGGGGARPGGAAATPAAQPAAPATFPPPPADYAVNEIPGVIAAGQKWTKVWEVSGNNADGILADKDGNVLIAQNHNGAVVKLDYKTNKVSTVYKDTHTGGALSLSKKGELFNVQRGLHQNVTVLAPKRRILADKLPNGDPLDCLGGVINDVTADSRGGAYFTMGGLFYASPNGVVTRYGEGLSTNGVILSADEKTLYVTNGAFGGPSGTVAAFDVQADGSLTNQREFVKLPAGGGDGLTIDSENRLYVTAGPNIFVVAPDGKLLGSIPAPYGLITAAFAGKDKRTMYAVVSLTDPTRLQHAYVYSIPMIAQGYKGRAK